MSKRVGNHIANSVLVEIVVIAVFWLLYLGARCRCFMSSSHLTMRGCTGGAAALSGYGYIGSCFGYSACHLARATLAFAWLGWITLTILLGLLVVGGFTSKAWTSPFTLDRADELNNRNTLFGRVVGDTLFNVLKLNEIELEPGSERPTYPPRIKSVEVRDNPFDDIVPRITAKERKEQERAKREMKIERAKEREQSKRKGTK